MFFTTVFLLSSLASFAQQPVGLLQDENSAHFSGILLAQNEEADAYDPFVDFSEYEEASEEEADINFFRNGRFFTLGFVLGYRKFTETLGSRIYDNGINYGLFLSYFFDLRFALQLTFTTGDHVINFVTPGGVPLRGNSAFTTAGLNLKYYFNTQNVTKGLGQLNPYAIGGFTQISRTSTLSGQSAFGKESATALEIGGGIELPLMRNKMYFGFQAAYQLVTFADENTEITVGAEQTGMFPTGDIINLTAILGVNF